MYGQMSIMLSSIILVCAYIVTVKSVFNSIPFERNIRKLIEQSIDPAGQYKTSMFATGDSDDIQSSSNTVKPSSYMPTANYMQQQYNTNQHQPNTNHMRSQNPIPNDNFNSQHSSQQTPHNRPAFEMSISTPYYDAVADSNEPIDPQDTYSTQPTFDGIYDRRQNFDVETPMEFQPESNAKPDARELQDKEDDYASETQSTDSMLTDGCLRCICEASSDCDPRVRCHVVGPVDYYCGPFQINNNYWNDAGRPGADQHDPLDFEACMNDLECSIDTVNGYMTKHGRDCDGDGRLTCHDFAKIHKGGPHGCNSTWVTDTPYWTKFRDCYFEY